MAQFQTVAFASANVITAGDLGIPPTFAFAVFSGWFQIGQIWQLSCSSPGGASGIAIDLGPTTLIVDAFRANHFACITSNKAFSAPVGNFVHLLASLDASATPHLQVYVNDVEIPGNQTALAGPIGNGTAWTLGRSAIGADQCAGDVWLGTLPAFCDLSVTANRRKFITAALQPVDLGVDGSAPFGTAPQMFLHVAVGGAASDFTSNPGTGGPFTPALGFGACGVIGAQPIPPLPPQPTVTLAMDDVSLLTIPTPGCQVSLQWSDDRAHVWGSPVSQRMGARGEYNASLQWQRLGLARDRVFQVFWSCPAKTVLLGASIEADTSAKT